ncbi:hypothetical protein R3P38DRAFT_2786406 [Favolaschia claudopus]|uniref:Uncharacterized protein n=1 Tax=Favolaschia claudopus TaxID=2862362 RepID=A0AAW0ASB8_9AGAR
MHPTLPRFEAVSLQIPDDPTVHAVLVYSLPGPDRKKLVGLYPADSPVSARCWSSQNSQSPVGFIGYVNGVVEKIKLIPLHSTQQVPKRMTLPSSEFITSPSRITKIVCHESGILYVNAAHQIVVAKQSSKDEGKKDYTPEVYELSQLNKFCQKAYRAQVSSFRNAWRAAFGHDYDNEDELTDLEEE